MTLDVATLVLALVTLAIVRIPQPPVTEAGLESRGSIWKESLYGFRYISSRPSLLGLQLLFAAGNLIDYAGYVLFAPMILARTGGNELVLGSVQSAGALGAVAGGLLLSMWGGPKRKMHGVLIGWALASLGMIAMGARPGSRRLDSPLPSFISFLSRSSMVLTKPSGRPKLRPTYRGASLEPNF